MPVPHDQWFRTPDLPGDRVHLVPLQKGHASGLLAAADDDEVFESLTIRRPATLDDAEKLVEHYRSRPDLVTWVQIDATTGTVAGVTSFYDIDPANRAVAIGHTWLGKQFWRTGINTESKLLLLGRAFDELEAVRVAWHTDIRNKRSQQAIERLGATNEGILRKHKRRLDKSWRDTVCYSMLDHEWAEARDRLARSTTS